MAENTWLTRVITRDVIIHGVLTPINGLLTPNNWSYFGSLLRTGIFGPSSPPEIHGVKVLDFGGL